MKEKKCIILVHLVPSFLSVHIKLIRVTFILTTVIQFFFRAFCEQVKRVNKKQKIYTIEYNLNIYVRDVHYIIWQVKLLCVIRYFYNAVAIPIWSDCSGTRGSYTRFAYTNYYVFVLNEIKVFDTTTVRTVRTYIFVRK